MDTSFSRRDFLVATAASAAVPAFHVLPRRRAVRPAVISSHNGLRSIEIALSKMKEGLAPVDAAVLAIEPVENDPNDDSVGYGGLPNEDGIVELDSCVMDGPSGLAGAVASLRNIKNPSQVALEVMRYTDHVLLVGEGALRFARTMGFKEQDLLTEASRKRWLEWKLNRSRTDDWVTPDENSLEPKKKIERKTGTIHVSCVNEKGELGASTSTSGLAFKIPGRVGDSPLIGCGCFLDNDVGSAGSTGRGEAAILSNGSALVVHLMREGKSPTDACLEACKRAVYLTRIPRLLNDKGRPDFQLNFYAVTKAGETGAAAIYPSKHARITDNGPEDADSAHVFDSAK